MNTEPELFPYSDEEDLIYLLDALASSNLIIDENVTCEELQNMLEPPLRMSGEEGSLLPHQRDAADKLLKILSYYNTAADTSDPGLGKTYLASYVAQQLNKPVFVISPKSSIHNWHTVLSKFGLPIVSVSNFDILRGNHTNAHNVKWYDMRKGYTDEATICPFIRRSTKKEYVSSVETVDTFVYDWNFPEVMTIIVDEAHYSKHQKTQTFGLVKGIMDASKKYGHKVIFLTATPIEKPKNLKTLLFMLGLIETTKLSDVKEYFKRHNIDFTSMVDVHSFLYDISGDPPKGRITSMVPEILPEGITNVIESVEVDIDDNDMQSLREEMTRSNNLSNQNSIRMSVEKLKIPSFVSHVFHALSDPGRRFRRIAIFVEHTDVADEIQRRLENLEITHQGAKTLLKPFITKLDGKQSDEATAKNIRDYVSGERFLLISTIKKGGTSISMHDIHGGLETLVLISPPTSATQLRQTLGRHVRTGQQSSVTQRIFFLKGLRQDDDLRCILSTKLTESSELTSGVTEDII